MHIMFHMLMLKRYMLDGSHKLSYNGLDVKLELFDEKEGDWILDYSSRTLHHREASLVKVRWSKQSIEEATWEHEDDMRARFPKHFAPNV